MAATRTVEKLRAWEKRMNSDVDVDIYAMGPLSMSVCSRLDAAATVQRVNFLMEGVTTWALSDGATFADGEPQPKPCERGGGRIHYLLE